MTEELENMKKTIVEIKQKYVVLNEKVSKNEQYSRKNNLIFICFKTPTENSTNTLSSIFAIMNIKNMQYDVCHFLKDKRQIIVKFNTTSDRDSVWTQISRLIKGLTLFRRTGSPCLLLPFKNNRTSYI